VDKIHENWREFISEEEKVRDMKVFAAQCQLAYGVNRTQQDILTDIRAIEGVTILTLMEPAVKSSTQERLKFKLKFTPRGIDLKQYTARLRKQIRHLDDVHDINILHVVKL